MSIGIAVAIGDAVVLVADGRQSDAYTVHTDEARKIVNLAQSISVIEIGAVMASTSVLDELRDVSPLPTAGGDFMKLLTESVRRAGAHLVSVVAPGSTDMSRIKVGFLTGGFDAGGAFIGGALFGHDMSEPSAQLVRPAPTPQFIVLGGETCGAEAYFERELERAYRACGSDQSTFVNMVKRAAKRTVHYAASHDRTIGGHVRYCVLRREQTSQCGSL